MISSSYLATAVVGDCGDWCCADLRKLRIRFDDSDLGEWKSVRTSGGFLPSRRESFGSLNPSPIVRCRVGCIVG